MAPGRVLVIAGSDSSGGAGLEADQKVLAAHGCYAMTATTALTAQNTQGVRNVHHVPPEFVRQQIDACLEDIGADVVKTGMLASAETVDVVAECVDRHKITRLVVDPVMVSTSGTELLPKDAISRLVKVLLPKTLVLTPNIQEAQMILEESDGHWYDIENTDDLCWLARKIQKLGPRYMFLKGGHAPLAAGGAFAKHDEDGKKIMNFFCDSENVIAGESKFIQSNNTHGTGCSIASAIAANIAKGSDVETATLRATRYVEVGIRTAHALGKGKGPINRFHTISPRAFSDGYFVEYLLDRPDVSKVWAPFVEHEFVLKMADGTLPLEAFKFYLVQDYLYLIQYARAYALAGYKGKTLEDISKSASIVQHIQKETALHLDYCKSFGLSEDEVKSAEESQACTAYSRYILDVGQSEDWLALQMALFPCLLGYGKIGKRLHDDPQTKREGNQYLKWIENYAAADFQKAVNEGWDLIDKHVARQSSERIEELIRIFIHATKMETGFWDMALLSNAATQT